VDWNSDGLLDIVSGDRNGNINLFISDTSGLVAYYRARIMVNGDSLNVGTNSEPTVIDWNCDGKKDLLVGCEAGYIYVYLNQNTDAAPLFQDCTTLMCNGSPIVMNRINPTVYDVDQDGVRDLICGANDGYVHFFRNSGTDSAPVFLTEETLMTQAGTQILPSGTAYGSRVAFGDWNNDGLTDFLISGYSGYVELYRGYIPTGVKTPPRLLTEKELGLRIGPNPLRNQVSVEFSLPRATRVELGLYDASGRLVSSLATGTMAQGQNRVTRTLSCPSGAYLLRLRLADQVFTRKLVIAGN
jgi:WD40 repeat protein